MFDFDKAVKLALKTWYPAGDSLRSDPHHPLMKLAGEWGELLDDYAKSLYKPGYEFDPIDELGDIWYYLRILCWQNKYKPINFCDPIDDVGFIIATAGLHSFEALCSYYRGTFTSKFFLDVSYTAIEMICEKYSITLEELTESNWEKLKPGSERGEQWMKNRK
jgi:hypothetical protein